MSLTEVLTVVGLTAGTLITIFTLMQKYVWPFIHIVNAAARLVDYELKHNGGTSVKDQLRMIDMNLSTLVEADSIAKETVSRLDVRISELEHKFNEKFP